MKKLKQFKQQQGFTIIEVMIVLAIAATIMLIVFLAVPNLQRNSRNNGRNSDAAKVAAAMNECLSNNNGQISSCNQAAILGASGTLGTAGASCNSGNGNISSVLTQLSCVTITATTLTSPFAFPATVTTSQVEVHPGNSCASPTTIAAGSTNQFVVLYQKETGGGTNANYCLGS